MSLEWVVKQWKMLAILNKHLTRGPSMNVQLNITSEKKFIIEISLEDDEGHGCLSAIGDSQLRCIIKVVIVKVT